MTADIVWDFDYIKYTIGSISEERSIHVVHRKSGNEYDFKTRTEMYGHWKTKSGGWLAEQNAHRLTPFTVDEFDIVDVQTPKPEKFALRAVNQHIENVTDILGTNDYYGYIGKGDSWRVEASTILKYKGQRADNLRPIHLDAIEQHLIKKHGAEIVRGLEADDQVVIDCTKNPELILIGVDKDYRGCALRLFNPDKMAKPEKINGFGRLYIGSDKKVHGEGRIWLYHQVLSCDSSDNYFANSATDTRWGEKNSYSLLSKCSNDKQAFEALIEGYKTLYPENKTIAGWRGNQIEIDWLYVMQENFTMAHMLRKPENDHFNVEAVLTKLGIEYERNI